MLLMLLSRDENLVDRNDKIFILRIYYITTYIKSNQIKDFRYF